MKKKEDNNTTPLISTSECAIGVNPRYNSQSVDACTLPSAKGTTIWSGTDKKESVQTRTSDSSSSPKCDQDKIAMNKTTKGNVVDTYKCSSSTMKPASSPHAVRIEDFFRRRSWFVLIEKLKQLLATDNTFKSVACYIYGNVDPEIGDGVQHLFEDLVTINLVPCTDSVGYMLHPKASQKVFTR
ncbi:hypothetical protein RFI_07877 [Reticulomyxa filosa]|uniref:Uncharacterized protein n=1 Tax=Reticulomyxa filosa TaxID=46433 RepID=X6NVD8_RETFI|nr:hypothetical protein RFI_07877 [Reticulomyxa filosa]|eukprot:ETO29247.1 hypothetical protein RFI_07877 [Reticulomyxa filosa]